MLALRGEEHVEEPGQPCGIGPCLRREGEQATGAVGEGRIPQPPPASARFYAGVAPTFHRRRGYPVRPLCAGRGTVVHPRWSACGSRGPPRTAAASRA